MGSIITRLRGVYPSSMGLSLVVSCWVGRSHLGTARSRPCAQICRVSHAATELGASDPKEAHLHVVEEHQARQGAERGVVQDTREHDVLEVADAVRLVDLSAHSRVRDGHHLERNGIGLATNGLQGVDAWARGLRCRTHLFEYYGLLEEGAMVLLGE